MESQVKVMIAKISIIFNEKQLYQNTLSLYFTNNIKYHSFKAERA